MKKNTLILIIFGLLSHAITFSQHVIDDANVTFKIRNLGFNVDGDFSKTQIEYDFSSTDISHWKLQGSVVVNSISTENSKRDAHLLKEDFFNVNRFPEITLKAESFDEIADNLYSVEVNLTIKAISKKIKVPMRIERTSTSESLYCSFEINRKDFGVGGSSLVMSNTVKIRVEYNLKKE